MRSSFLVLFTFVIGIFCWGQEGHEAVAQIAWNLCSDTTQNALSTFLGSKTLESIAPLPDDYAHTAQGTWSDEMHYNNLPKGSTHFSMSGCPNLCVVKAISNYSQILQSEASNPFACDYTLGDEPCALEFLTHFCGDIHQPLHVSFAYDRGGNSVQVMFFTTKTNLHDCWDTRMIQKWTKDVDTVVTELQQIMSQNSSMVEYYASNMDVETMASESFYYVLTTVYNYTMQNGLPYIGQDYYDANLPIIKSRLIGGGVRLATFLNNIFDPSFKVQDLLELTSKPRKPNNNGDRRNILRLLKQKKRRMSIN